MGKITGFMEIKRETPSRRPVGERLKDWREFDLKMSEEKLKAQGARCMDCGIPFCHKGCRWATLFPTGMTWFTAGASKKLSIGSIGPTTFRNLPAGSAPRRAKKPASSTSTASR